jgi:hypothetical protein
MKEFYNTTNESGEQLELFTQKAMKQEDKVMLLFKEKYALTAYQCYSFFIIRYESNIPLTSIRRAITNLTNKGKLRITRNKQVGGYGRDNYVYKLR